MESALTNEQKEFIKAVKQGNPGTVRALLSHHPHLVRTLEDDGATPLHHAAWKGHVEVARLLIEAGADVNAVNENTHYGGTPLHAAAHGNQKAVVELLLAAGADVKIVSCNGRTPLQETEIHKATAAAKLLKAEGA
jgi:ankyrin repeat protein